MDDEEEEPTSPTPTGQDSGAAQTDGLVPADVMPDEIADGFDPVADPSCGQAGEAAGSGPAITLPVARPLGYATSASPRPWGFWATMGWSTLVMGLLVLVQIIVLLVILAPKLARDPKLDVKALHLETNGLVLGVATMVTTPLCVGFVLLLIRLRHCPVGEYLGWRWPGRAVAWRWAIVALVFVASCDVLYGLIKGNVVPPFMTEAYQTAGSLPLLILAVCMAAPVFEEVLFRGFMFHGIACSRLGAIAAVPITAAAWAIIHLQYDWVGIAGVFLSGILLGIARLKTRSIALTMLLHALQNVLATIEVAVYVRVAG